MYSSISRAVDEEQRLTYAPARTSYAVMTHKEFAPMYHIRATTPLNMPRMPSSFHSSRKMVFQPRPSPVRPSTWEGETRGCCEKHALAPLGQARSQRRLHFTCNLARTTSRGLVTAAANMPAPAPAMAWCNNVDAPCTTASLPLCQRRIWS